MGRSTSVTAGSCTWSVRRSPTIVIDAGGGEIQEYRDYAATFTSRLAQQRRVCAYDRAGHGRSDPAPNKPRQLEDLTGDLHALLAAAGVGGPLVLVGNSFGGFDHVVLCRPFSEDVAGVILLDVPAPSATMTVEDEPELAWDHPGNVEHNDVVAGFENRLADEQFPFDAPLLVVTGESGRIGRSGPGVLAGLESLEPPDRARMAGTSSMSTRQWRRPTPSVDGRE